MLPADLGDVRLFLHVLAACVWVGGQAALAGLVPVLRSLGPDAPKLAARRFARIAWSAYAVLVITGIWNLLSIDVGSTSTAWQATLFAKLAVVALSGIGAYAHQVARTKAALAAWGAIGALASLGALWLGLLLHP